MRRVELVALMAAIIDAGDFAAGSGGRGLDAPEVVQRASTLLREAEEQTRQTAGEPTETEG